MSKAYVELQIKENKVVVFSKTYCPYCKKAKETLSSTGLKDYTLIELDQRDDGDEIQDILKGITGARSVPRVFIGGKFVGGGDKVVELANTGKLKPMLLEAGAL